MPHEKYQECIEACNECAVECIHCANMCLQEEKPDKLRRCIALNQQCADICQMAARYMAGGSEFTERICALCAEICEACGAECKSHDHDHCEECADVCMECARTCREMAGITAV